MNLVSRVGNAMVCGFAGDVAIFSNDLASTGMAGHFSQGHVPTRTLRPGVCPVSEVFPLERGDGAQVAAVTPAG